MYPNVLHQTSLSCPWFIRIKPSAMLIWLPIVVLTLNYISITVSPYNLTYSHLFKHVCFICPSIFFRIGSLGQWLAFLYIFHNSSYSTGFKMDTQWLISWRKVGRQAGSQALSISFDSCDQGLRNHRSL